MKIGNLHVIYVKSLNEKWQVAVLHSFCYNIFRMKRPLPLGISDFKIVREKGYAYVDKTLLIQELVEHENPITLIPRMRRFGKTLNLSMLKYFFEIADEETAHLF